MAREPLIWWMSPRKAENHQWWFGYQKVRLIKLPDAEKRKYLEKQNGFKATR